MADDEPSSELSVPLTASAGLPVLGAPDSVTVTVTAADGAELGGHEADLEWIRVGGSEECGGPYEATVVVPAP